MKSKRTIKDQIQNQDTVIVLIAFGVGFMMAWNTLLWIIIFVNS